MYFGVTNVPNWRYPEIGESAERVKEKKPVWELIKHCFKTSVKVFKLYLADPVFSFQREKGERTKIFK